jgi:hypothetical protein
LGASAARRADESSADLVVDVGRRRVEDGGRRSGRECDVAVRATEVTLETEARGRHRSTPDAHGAENVAVPRIRRTLTGTDAELAEVRVAQIERTECVFDALGKPVGERAAEDGEKDI